MKRVLLLQLLTAFVFTIPGFNQGWDFTYDYAPSIGKQVIQAHDSNFVVTEKGHYSLPGSTIKLNKFGEVLWVTPHGGHSIQQTFDGGYLVAGDSSTWAANVHKASFRKLNSDGIEEWYHTYGNTEREIFNAVIQDSESNFVACGTAGPYYKYYIVKTNNDGDLIWEKIIEIDDSGYCCDLIEVNNFYYIAGYRVDEVSFNDFEFYLTLIKLNHDGSTEWILQYEMDYVTGFSIALTSDSSLITTGANKFVKFDLDGNIKWEKSPSCYSQSVEPTNDNGFILSGNQSGYNCLIKFDSSGNLEWSQVYPNGNSTVNNYFKSAINTFDQGYVACGCSTSDSTRLRIIKTDGSGNIVGEIEFSQPENLKIYPNPTFDFITIETNTQMPIEIFDINSKLIISKRNANNSISLSENPPGIYFVKIKTESGIGIYKVIKL